MTPQELLPLVAWLTPRLLLLFGFGFLIANVRLGALLWAYRRRMRSALLVWQGEKPKYYGFSLALGVVLGILLIIEAFVLMRSPRSIFGELAISYVVTPTGDDRSRITVKLMVRYPRRARFMRHVPPVGDWVMMRKQLRTLTKLAERDHARMQ